MCYDQYPVQTWHNSYIPLYTSIAVFGAMISSLGSGYLMKFSKLNLIHGVNIVLIVGNLICQIDTVWVQLVGRFMWGLAVGVFTVLVPKFINETAPSELKGPFGAMS